MSTTRPIALIEVLPMGTQRGYTLAYPGEVNGRPRFVEVEENVYPPEHTRAGHRLSMVRTNLGVSMKTAAKALGIATSDLYRLEAGELTVSNWEDVFDRITRARRA